MKHLKEILNFLRRGDWKETPDGLLVHNSGILRGRYR